MAPTTKEANQSPSLGSARLQPRKRQKQRGDGGMRQVWPPTFPPPVSAPNFVERGAPWSRREAPLPAPGLRESNPARLGQARRGDRRPCRLMAGGQNAAWDLPVPPAEGGGEKRGREKSLLPSSQRALWRLTEPGLQAATLRPVGSPTPHRGRCGG